MSTHEQLLLQVARQELGHLWFDLVQLRWLHDRQDPLLRWIVPVEEMERRIVSLTQAVGPTPWREVPLTLLKDGTYDRIYRAAGIPYPPVDWAEVFDLHASGVSQRLIIE